MNHVQIRVLFDRKHEATLKKAALVQLEVTFNRKRKFISTHIKLFKNQFKNGRICGRTDAETLNEKLNFQICEIEKLVQKFNSQELAFNLEALDALENNCVADIDFLTFLEQRIEDRYIAESTKKQHRKVLNFLKNEYKLIKNFYDLTPVKLQHMDEYLHKRNIGTKEHPVFMMQTSIYVYHKTLKHYINEAILHGYMEKSPYNNLKFERGQNAERTVLTMEEINMICNYESTSVLNCKVRDLFIVQCYTGLAYADLMSVDFSRKEKHGSIWVVHDDRQKTGTGYYITLLPRVMAVLERYGGKLPHLSYDVYNRNLKAVATAAGVMKHVTTHIGRHTFATTIALGSGIPIEVVSRMLDHTDIKPHRYMPKSCLSKFLMALIRFPRIVYNKKAG